MQYYDPDTVSMEVTNVVAEGEQVALEWITRGRTASGNDYENFYSAIFVVREGGHTIAATTGPSAGASVRTFPVTFSRIFRGSSRLSIAK